MSKAADFQVLLNRYRQQVRDTRIALEFDADNYRAKLTIECEIAQELQDLYEAAMKGQPCEDR
jgi:hypothetical protein